MVKDYVNLGIAAATPRGLIVPNVKDAGRLSLAELAGALADLTATAREGKTSPTAMSGGTITITNVGVFGVDTGTPILNPGESAILAFGAIREMPWVHKGRIKVRQVTQLALSFDHRIIDGELGSHQVQPLHGRHRRPVPARDRVRHGHAARRRGERGAGGPSWATAPPARARSTKR